MTIQHNKIVLAAGSVLLITSVFAAAFFSLPALYFVPFVLLAAFLLVQYPVALFYLLLLSIPWSIEANFTESLGTDLPDEPLMLLLAFSVLALFFIRVNDKKNKVPSSILLILLLASFGWSAVTVAMSTNVLLSVKYLLAKGWYLLAFVGAPLLFINDKRKIKNAALALLVSMLVVTTVCLIKQAAFKFSFARTNDALAPFFRNHVNYSALLVFMVPIQLAFYRLAESRRQRLFVGLAMIVVLAALALSYARGAWLALAIGLMAYWLIKKRWLLKSYLLSIVFIGSLLVWLQYNDNYLRFAPQHDTTIFHEDFAEHLIATYKGNDVSTAERFYRWVAGVRMSGEHWATGFGPTTFYQQYKSYALPAFRTWVSDNREQSTVHNYFLLLLIEQGVVGLLLFVLLIGFMFWKAQEIYRRSNDPFWKTASATIAAILWMQCTVNFLSDLIEADKVGSVFYLCLSFLIIADVKTKQQVAAQSNKE